MVAGAISNYRIELWIRGCDIAGRTETHVRIFSRDAVIVPPGRLIFWTRMAFVFRDTS